jgi:hypothetical protein
MTKEMTMEIEKKKEKEFQNTLRKTGVFLNLFDSGLLITLAAVAIFQSSKIYGSILPGLIFSVVCFLFLIFNFLIILVASKFIPKRISS